MHQRDRLRLCRFLVQGGLKRCEGLIRTAVLIASPLISARIWCRKKIPVLDEGANINGQRRLINDVHGFTFKRKLEEQTGSRFAYHHRDTN